jgi:hypothetical protein
MKLHNTNPIPQLKSNDPNINFNEMERMLAVQMSKMNNQVVRQKVEMQ